MKGFKSMYLSGDVSTHCYFRMGVKQIVFRKCLRCQYD